MSALIQSFNSTFLEPTETLLYMPGMRAFWTNRVATAVARINDPDVSLKGALRLLRDSYLLSLGVTEISINGAINLAKSSVIGGTEINYLMGNKNDIIVIQFQTNKFPGALASAIVDLIEETSKRGETIYIVDNLVSVRPCFIVNSSLSLSGKDKNIISGKLTINTFYVKKDNVELEFDTNVLAVTTTAINNLISALPTDSTWIGKVTREIV